MKAGSTFVADSVSTQHQLAEHLNRPLDSIHVVPLACDRERFHPNVSPGRIEKVRQKHGLGNDPYVTFVGTLEPRKNIATTIAGFGLFLQQHPNHRAHFLIGGRLGWGNLRPITSQLEQVPKARWIDQVDEEELPALYAGAEALVFVSHYEGFGLPLLEAMSCGAPVIYGDNSSMPELVRDGGLPAESTSAFSIADCLSRVLTNRALRNQLAEKAVQRADLYSWTRTAQETLQLYHKCLQQTVSTVSNRWARSA